MIIFRFILYLLYYIYLLDLYYIYTYDYIVFLTLTKSMSETKLG